MANNRAISVLVHSDTKVGKTRLANTSPAPRLLLDAEAAHRFLPEAKVFWDPMTENPPVYDGTWETCVVIARDYATVSRTYDWLNQGAHPFVSLNIDSITEIQVKCKDQITGDSISMDQQRWGELLVHMERLVRGFRDLTEHPRFPLQSVVITAMTVQRDGKWRPYVQGQLMTKLPYFIDVIGYLYVETVPGPDPTTPPTRVRRMLVSPHPQFEAGQRVGEHFGEVLTNPTVPSMLDLAFGPVQPTQGVVA